MDYLAFIALALIIIPLRIALSLYGDKFIVWLHLRNRPGFIGVTWNSAERAYSASFSEQDEEVRIEMYRIGFFFGLRKL